MYGVSPAYFYSSFGPGFRPADILDALPGIRDLGYGAFQPEAFRAEISSAWTGADSGRIADRARDLGLSIGPFVAHWLGSNFATPEALGRRGLPEGTARALEIAAALGGAQVFAVPLPALVLDREGGSAHGAAIAAVRAGLRGALVERLGLLAEAARRAGFRPALELLPGNVLGGSAEFRDLLSIPGLENLGLVLDTGHFHAMGEDVPSLPGQLGGAIAATHLCDNDGIENLSRPPGDGTIPFRPLLAALAASGYRGGLDVEIVCPPGDVAREYRKARETLDTWMPPPPASPPRTAAADPRVASPDPMNAPGPGARNLERSPV